MQQPYSKEPTDEDINNYMSLLLRAEVNEIPRFKLEAFKQTNPKIHEGILKGVIDGEYLDETEILRNAKIPVAALARLNEQAHNLGYLKGWPYQYGGIPFIWYQMQVIY